MGVDFYLIKIKNQIQLKVTGAELFYNESALLFNKNKK